MSQGRTGFVCVCKESSKGDDNEKAILSNAGSNAVIILCSFLPLSMSEVRSPVLLLWGEQDTFLEQDMAEACRLYIRNHFRLNIISGASHWLQQDQPDIVNTLIWTFLKEGEGRKNYRT